MAFFIERHGDEGVAGERRPGDLGCAAPAPGKELFCRVAHAVPPVEGALLDILGLRIKRLILAEDLREGAAVRIKEGGLDAAGAEIVGDELAG